MADLRTIESVLKWLAAVTAGRELSQPLFDLWAHSFEEVEDEQLKQAAVEYAQLNRFFPVPLDLLRLMGKAPMEAGLAWAKVGEFLDGRVEYQDLPDGIKRCLKAMGGAKYVKEQATKDMRIAFFQMYESIADDGFVTEVRERARLKAPILIAGLLEGKDV